MSEQEWVADAWRHPISAERKAELKTLAGKQREWVAQPHATRAHSVLKDVKLTRAAVFGVAGEGDAHLGACGRVMPPGGIAGVRHVLADSPEGGRQLGGTAGHDPPPGQCRGDGRLALAGGLR